MGRETALLSLLLAAACTQSRPAAPEIAERKQTAAPPLPAPAPVPTGATLEPSGLATILRAPSPAYPDQPPPAENRPTSEAGWYASSFGISIEEAETRRREQAATRPEMTRVLAQVRAREPGNFTAVRLVHEPDWAYVFYFKRDPQATLARYSRHPRLQAAQARYTQAELDAMARPWIERFAAQRLLGGHGSDPTYGEIRVDLVVSRAEFEAIAARDRWAIPDAIKLAFAEPIEGPAVPATLARFVRLFPHGDRALGATHQAAIHGRILLRDGCLFVSRNAEPERLAYFPRELGLALDEAGYLSLATRTAGRQIRGRIGEEFVWAGPLGPVPEDAAGVRDLRRLCGSAPIEAVGMAESRHLFRVRPFAIDDYVRQRRVGRQQAWDEIKACWRRQDAGEENSGRQCDSPAR